MGKNRIVLTLVILFISLTTTAEDIRGVHLIRHDRGLITVDSQSRITEYVQLLNYMMLMDIKINGVNLSDGCAKFMNEDMVRGPLGKFIYNEVLTNGKTKYPELMTASSLGQLCPKFPKMSDAGKAEIITLLLATMAHFESSCNQNTKIKSGPNGKLIGLYQLHLGKEDIYDGAAKHCVKNAGYSTEKASVCTLSMLNLQIKNREGQIFSSKSYWDVLRPSGHASKLSQAPQNIKKALVNMSSCK